MPAKGSKLRLGNRDYIFNKKFYEKNLVTDSKVTLTFDQSKNIVETSNKIISEIMLEEIDGFKLPHGLGYLCISKFKTKNPAIDWKKTKELGKRVYFLNLHTLGYSIRTMWFRIGRIRNIRFHEVFKFEPYELFTKKISKSFAGGKPYNEWTLGDYVEKGRLENLYNKKYRKEQK